MKFTRSTCPQIPGCPQLDHPRWVLAGDRFTVDVEWNTRWPFGGCLAARYGDRQVLVDINAPFGEPNRVHLTGPRRHHMIGLVAWNDFSGRCRPHVVRGQRYDWAAGRAWDWRDPAAWRWWTSRPAKPREPA
jgi:hypothetical protein